ncbi:MAG TPA: uroporphyrinogen-III C-methyltransferase [Terriglobales bacterium]|nr:uroporphyrinogen-III C-methyltransferase [Terriglobales bacterium]
MSIAQGKVYLVGAGPGHPDLLTIKAARILREADFVLHDDLVSQEILALLPRQATVLSVGKRCGMPKTTQAEINAKMIAYARAGRAVVRLKCGDPMIFGRASEEIEALRNAEVTVEVVPGISAAIAAAAAAQVALTDRRSSSSVIFESGHPAQSGTSVTRVIYMPGPNWESLASRLISGGIAPDTPCMAVSAASGESEILRHCSLSEIPQIAVLAPSILIVGEACAGATRDSQVSAPKARYSLAQPVRAG